MAECGIGIVHSGIDPADRTEGEMAWAFVNALSAFIREIGLPTTFAEMGIPTDTDCAVSRECR